MLRHCLLFRSNTSEIRAGRQMLAQQFSGMSGWQAGQDPRFDAYVSQQRRAETLEGFDQRVERAYSTSAKLHRTEVINGFKRKLKSDGTKFTAATLRDMNQAVESRLEWLREVFAQIDADYRSGDAQRQEAAAAEVSKALAGEPSDFVEWMYERKRTLRTLGPKGKAQEMAEHEDANLPEVSDDEANRYLNLRINMLEIERNVKEQYGVAGQAHWAALQEAKDRDYEDKLERAAEKYKELIDQEQRHHESQSSTHLRAVLERTHAARVRFEAAMELEAEREKLLEAHQAMRKERREALAERNKAQLKEAAELRAAGKPTGEVAAALKQRTLDELVERQEAYRSSERRELEQKKESFLGLIEKLRRGAEEREGQELLHQNQREQGHPLSQPNLRKHSSPTGLQSARTETMYGSPDGDSLAGFGLTAQERELVQNAASTLPGRSSASASSVAAPAPNKEEGRLNSHAAQRSNLSAQELLGSDAKKALWRSIHSDKYEDPFLTVHQARVDADKNYDSSYSKAHPTTLALGSRRVMRQGMGEYAVGNEQDDQILQDMDARKVMQWGMQGGFVHYLDGDGDREYLTSDQWHVRDKKTGDIDFKEERRGGGPVFRGPRFYKIGEKRDSKDPSNLPMDGPLPAAAASQSRERQVQRAKASLHGGRSD